MRLKKTQLQHGRPAAVARRLRPSGEPCEPQALRASQRQGREEVHGMKARRRRPSCVGARQSAHGRRRPAPAECGRASRRRKRCRWGIGNLVAILGFGGSLGAWAGGERHFGPDWRCSGAGVRIRMKFFGRYVFLSGPTDIHDISGVSAKFRRKCFPWCRRHWLLFSTECSYPDHPHPYVGRRLGNAFQYFAI